MLFSTNRSLLLHTASCNRIKESSKRVHSHGAVDLNTQPWSSGSQHTPMEQWISTHSHGAVDLNTQPWSSGSQHTAMEQWISTHSHGAVDLNTQPWSSGSQHTPMEQWISTHSHRAVDLLTFLFLEHNEQIHDPKNCRFDS